MILIITTSKPQNYIRAQHNYKKKNGPDPLIMPHVFFFFFFCFKRTGDIKIECAEKAEIRKATFLAVSLWQHATKF